MLSAQAPQGGRVLSQTRVLCLPGSLLRTLLMPLDLPRANLLPPALALSVAVLLPWAQAVPTSAPWPLLLFRSCTYVQPPSSPRLPAARMQTWNTSGRNAPTCLSHCEHNSFPWEELFDGMWSAQKEVRLGVGASYVSRSSVPFSLPPALSFHAVTMA